MATSGTTTFESTFSIDDIITEAYERLGRLDRDWETVTELQFTSEKVK